MTERGHTLIFDLESDGLLDKLTKIHVLVIKDFHTKEVFRADNPSAICVAKNLLENAQRIVGHNIIKFDLPAILKTDSGFQWGHHKLPQVFDTLTMSRLVYPNMAEVDAKKRAKDPEYLPGNLTGNHSLKSWGYRLGLLKGDFGDTTDWSEYTDEMGEYCERDVEVTEKLYELLLSKEIDPRARDLEHEFQYWIFEQEKNGFGFDVQKAVELASRLAIRRNELEVTAAEIFPGWDVPTKTPEWWSAVLPCGTRMRASTKGEARRLVKAAAPSEGFKLKDVVYEPGPVKLKHDDFTLSSRDKIARALTELHGWKPKSFTDGGKPKVDETTLKDLPWPLAECAQEYLMLQKKLGQISEGDKAWLKKERQGVLYGRVITVGTQSHRCSHIDPNLGQVPKPGKPYGRECRELFIARPGYVLFGFDVAGIQLRGLAHYMSNYDGGEYVSAILKEDIHTVNQRMAELETRDAAKTLVYAFLFGGGDPKLGTIVGGGRAAGKALREKFLTRLPALGKLSDTVQKVAKQRGYLVGLDGRKIPINSPRIALNYLLQCFEAVIVKDVTCRVNRKATAESLRYRQVAHVHDEFQMEVNPDDAQRLGELCVESLKESTEYFNLRCPVDGEFKTGRNWAETH